MVAEKIEGYAHFLTNGRDRWTRFASTVRDFRVLVVTTNEGRTTRLAESWRSRPGVDLAFVMTEKALRTQHPLVDPIWFRWSTTGQFVARRLISESHAAVTG